MPELDLGPRNGAPSTDVTVPVQVRAVLCSSTRYAGDDAAAKQVVADLLASPEFRPVDAGSLRMARSLEELAFLNISLNARNGWTWQSGWRLAGPTA